MFGYYNKNIETEQMFAFARHCVWGTDASYKGGLMMNRRIARRRVRNLMIVLLMILAFCSGFFGHTLLNAHAEEEYVKPMNRYYTSIQLKQGDSLWDIAAQYLEGSGYTTKEYVEELKRMNGLRDEHIHSGEYLTVVYFAE